MRRDVTARRTWRRARPLWVCPRCGLALVSRNQWHSCGWATLDEWKRRMGPGAMRLYERFEQVVSRCGEYRLMGMQGRLTMERRTPMAAKPTTVDEYLAGLSDDKRVALEKVRRAIKAAAPRVEECISYQLPAFKLDGRLLVCVGAASKHCALYGAMPLGAFKKEFAAFETSKGTIRFTPDRPIPATLVRKLIKAKIAERAAATSRRAQARAVGKAAATTRVAKAPRAAARVTKKR